MGGNIYFLHEADKLTAFAPTLFDNEERFQTLIARNPDILAGDQINPDNPRRWVLIAREMGVPAEQDGLAQWSLDHLFLDQDAIPTLVEVKRSTDTRLRREVVGQMLDYAANGAIYWPLETLQKCYEAQLECGGTSLSDIGVAPEEETDFWQRVKDNLRNGKIRLLFVADIIPPELQRIIEFLNGQMSQAEVLGIEIRFFASEGHSVFVPGVYGRTGEAIQSKQGGRIWDEESVLADIAKVSGPAGAEIGRSLIRAFEQMGCYVWWGRGKSHGSYTIGIKGTKNYMFSVYANARYTTVQLYFAYFPEDKRLEMKHRFEQIPGIRIPAERLAKYPGIDLLQLKEPLSFDLFVSIFKDYIADIMK